MPAIAAAASAAISYVSTAFAASAAGTATLAQMATVLAVKTAASLAMSAATAALMAPRTDRAGSPTDWQSDPNAGTPFAMGGRQGIGGRIVFRKEFAPTVANMYLGIVTVWSGAGPVKGLEDFLVEGQPQTFNVNQQNTGRYGDKMYFSYQLGDQPEATALASPSILRSSVTVNSAGWTADHKLSGKAAEMLTLGHDDVGDVYPGGVEPKTMRLLEGGIILYDPRNDDTQTAIGGAGDERWDDRSTWGHPDNPVIGALNWALGLYENGQRVGGIGIPMDMIRLEMFAEAANVADINGWTFAAYPTTVDDKWQVLTGLLQAGGAMPCTVDGKLGCWSRGAPRTSLHIVTMADLAGAPKLDLSQSRLGRVNTVYPACRLESAGWDVVPLAEAVSFPGLVEEDRGPRGKEIQYRYVPVADQCAELAGLDLFDTRELLSGVLPCKPHMRHFKAGDSLTLDLPFPGMAGRKILVLGRPDFDVGEGVVNLAFRSETDSKYELALGQTGTEPPPVDPGGPPDIPTPDADDWFAYGSIVGGKGVITVLGEPGLPIASWVRVEYRIYGTSAWTLGNQGAASQGRFVIGNLASTADYEVAISYYNIAGAGPGPRLILGPISVDETGAGSGGMTASAFPDTASGFGTGTPVTTGSVTVTPSGGTGPFTYSWTHLSGDSFTIDSPSSATTPFSRNVGSGQSFAGIARCTVTDSASNTFNVDIGVYFDA